MQYKNKTPGYAVFAVAIVAIMLSSCSSKGQDAPPVNAADSSITFQTQQPQDSDLGKGIVQSKSKSSDAPIDKNLEVQIPTKNTTDVSQNEIVRFIIPGLTADANLNSYIYYNDSGMNNAKIPLEYKITSEHDVVMARATIPASIDKGKYVVSFEKVISGLTENDNNYKAVIYSAPIMVK